MIQLLRYLSPCTWRVAHETSDVNCSRAHGSNVDSIGDNVAEFTPIHTRCQAKNAGAEKNFCRCHFVADCSNQGAVPFAPCGRANRHRYT
jgi:hypothetical protein